MEKNTVTVYWAPMSSPQKQGQQVLFDLKPKSLLSDLHKRKAKKPLIPHDQAFLGNYQACSAFHELGFNIFVIVNPLDFNVKFNELGQVVRDMPILGFFNERISSLENSICVDYDMPSIFFCEESLNMKVTPPYMHNTSVSKHGFISPVKYDIGSWFRQLFCIFQLWEGVNELILTKNEPLAYLEFETEKQVIFKEFVLTEEIFGYIKGCEEYKEFFKFQPLKSLYQKFHQTRLRDRVLRAIQQNVIPN